MPGIIELKIPIFLPSVNLLPSCWQDTANKLLIVYRLVTNCKLVSERSSICLLFHLFTVLFTISGAYYIVLIPRLETSVDLLWHGQQLVAICQQDGNKSTNHTSICDFSSRLRLPEGFLPQVADWWLCAMCPWPWFSNCRVYVKQWRPNFAIHTKAIWFQSKSFDQWQSSAVVYCFAEYMYDAMYMQCICNVYVWCNNLSFAPLDCPSNCLFCHYHIRQLVDRDTALRNKLWTEADDRPNNVIREAKMLVNVTKAQRLKNINSMISNQNTECTIFTQHIYLLMSIYFRRNYVKELSRSHLSTCKIEYKRTCK